ncbi:MAG: thymidylate synthase, thymidylate synthase [Candidatus Peregrinibacteria bacterium GW2011_GWF2_33_10]|nr:MAG: thymidylate synthase, thymidylate synthase [Candidatus Peregrinibacteria bacterium GW2011_GWF2_33_10]OGJ45629.1 MAG: thymidylate synthase [Candidatus Peregrinibacteria bacterium RIFOXYA2_FULL_33_21]OGJ46574.1 MAG: thymidylate synthase [Candidatus Peregrinibacteria bacterium RIFOXYA12_FULL_33_12]OGJ51220.1 MAG: thymidylate synthase [Candidatus Peregrinibacteria bacterium RIFOXYB2_FULL_33_20]
MQQYLSLVREILRNGEERKDRTGTGTISIFGAQRKYDLCEGFPLVTTKKVNLQNIIAELLWFLSGSTNINEKLERLNGKSLHEITKIWDDWADKQGELGPVYGYQWRKWKTYDGKFIDQIQNAIDMIRHNPSSRRILVNAWNVADIDKMALPPCHMFFQFYVINGRLDCQLYQRSADVALGVPYNIASYAVLMHMIAEECNLEAGIFTHTTGDTHIYLNHIEGLKLQLTRKPHVLPKIKIAKKAFWDLKLDDFTLENYEYDPFIKFEIAV